MCLEIWKLKFFDSKEWKILEERMYAYSEKGIQINPHRGDLFRALDATSYHHVRAVILGQDPYPQASLATGVAFDIPPDATRYPPTLLNILKEYSEDLGHPYPSSGSLLPWCKQGVLLWNVIPTCFAGRPASHRDWTEWSLLTQEILEKINERESVLVCSLGNLARSYCDNCNHVISFSHPSPLAALKGSRPFLGSRVFSTINLMLVELGKDPIDWRLP